MDVLIKSEGTIILYLILLIALILIFVYDMYLLSSLSNR